MSALRIIIFHPADGELRAYLDGEMGPDRRDELTDHLARCPRCRIHLAVTEEAARLASAKLRELQIVVASAHAALPPAGFPPHRKEEKSVSRSRRFVKAVAAVAASVMILGSLFLLSPGLRARAAEYLTAFRFKEIQVMRVTPDDFGRLRQAPTPTIRRLDGLIFPTGAVQEAAMPASEQILEADAVTKGLRVPAYLPKGFQPYWSVQYTPGWEIRHPLDLPAINQVLRDAGEEYRLPVGLENPVIHFRNGPEFWIRYTDGTHQVRIHQGGKREFRTTDGLDLGRLLAVVLARQAEEQGASPGVVQQLLEADLFEAVPYPLAKGAEGEVKVNGVTGLFQREGDRNRLVWISNGQHWELWSTLPQEEVLKIAESIRP